MTDTQKTLLYLIRVAIGNDHSRKLDGIDWNALLDLSARQGVTSIVCDGLQILFDNGYLKERVSFEMISTIMQQENDYAIREKTIHDLSAFYQKHEIRMMVLKGWGLSQNYPVPKHRHCSDIDIYLFGDYKRGDKLLSEKLGIRIDNSHHRHTVFNINGVSIENHYDFVNVHGHHSAKQVEKRLKELADCAYQENDIWLPSAEFNALFVLYHAACHFAATEISLRSILDWGLFVRKNYLSVDWAKHWEFCKQMNMHQFLLAMNEICVNYFGFPAKFFNIGGDLSLAERVLNDILQPEFTIEKGHGVFPYIKSRYIKWRRNSWKHKMVYPESMTVTFFQQAWSHLLKPATLRN